MRMWNVDPKLMCDQHVLGEHLEIHMFLGSFNDGMSLTGYLQNGLLELHSLEKRHNELVRDFKRRGWPSGIVHATPLKFEHSPEGSIDVKANIEELSRRCKNCRALIKRQK